MRIFTALILLCGFVLSVNVNAAIIPSADVNDMMMLGDEIIQDQMSVTVVPHTPQNAPMVICDTRVTTECTPGQQIPEPSTFLLMGLPLFLIGFLRRRKR